MARAPERSPRTDDAEARDVQAERPSVTGDLDAFVGEAIPPRALVPSDRERAGGADVQEGYRYQRAEDLIAEDEDRPSARERFVGYVKEMDPRGIGGDKRAIYLLPIAGALAQLDDAMIGLLGPEIQADFGFSIQFLFTLTSMMTLMQIMLAPVFGYVADRANRIWMARIGGFINNGGSIVFGLASGIGGLIGGKVMQGSGQAIASPAAFPLIADYIPTEFRTRAYAYFTATARLAGLVSPLAAGLVAERYGWRSGTVTFGLIALGATGLLFFLKEPVRGGQERRELGADEATVNDEPPPMSWGESWRAAASIVTVRRLWYATPFLMLGGSGFLTLSGLLYAQQFQMGPSARATLFTAISAVGLILVVFSGPFGDRLLSVAPQRVMVAYGGVIVLGGVGAASIAFIDNLPLVILFSLPGMVLGALFQAAQATLFSMVIPARIRGLGMQTFLVWQIPALILLPFVVGSLADAVGIQTAMLAFLPILVIGGVIAGSAATGVGRDIRAAKAAALAEHEAKLAKEQGRNKMLICRDVDVTYGGTQVLFGVDLDVEEGEIVALLGTNGAGKSTMLRAIAGIQEASNGAIYLDGRDVTHVPPHENAQNGIVMVPGGRAIFPTLTVEENLRTAAWMYREDEAYVEAKTEEVLEMFPRLRERYEEQAGNMSGGEQQMLALGQAFLMRPRILMIDELSLGLAPQIVEQLLETVRRIHEQGTTIVLVEQSLNVALTIAERAVFMEKGEIRFDGPTAELLQRPELIRSVFMGGAVTGRAVTTGRRAAGESERILEVEDVSVSFGGVKALTDVSIDLNAGEIVGIIGPNGAGKTTLFDVISGFVQPDRGAVMLEATDVTNLGPDARARLRMGRSFQSAQLFPSMTVRDNIAVALERRAAVRNPALAAVWAPQVRESERRIYQRVDVLIEILGLEAYANKFVNELSTGSRRAVDLACIMASQPRVLMLDEPSSGLAQAETEELGPVIRRLVRETGCGVLIIEHDMPLITAVSDRLVAMELGRVVVSGSPEEVVNHPQVVRSYLSASEGALARSEGGRLAELMRSATDEEDPEATR